MKKKGIIILLSFLIFIITILFNFPNIWIRNALCILSYLLVGWEVLRKAIKNIFKGELFDENFLMSIATIGAISIGSLQEAVSVMLFYQIGEFFQDYAVDKSKKSITDLMNIRPDYANLFKNKTVKKVSLEEVKKGDTLIIRAGEKIPVDGVVIEGSSTLDTKALTGEILPKDVGVGSEVLSGCINLDGLLKIRVSKEFKESTVSKILDLVENASNKKSQSEKFITKFAKYYTPTVVTIALIMITIIPFITKESFSIWLYRSLSFLVVSCPCALVISIPLSFFGGIGGASKMGILIKGSNYLEALSKVDTIIFDKTATLTQGIFKVQKVMPIAISKEELLRYASYAEVYSQHPIAYAVKEAYHEKIDESEIKSVKELPGYGIKANIGGHTVLAGNEKLLEDAKIPFEKCKDNATILYIAVDSEYKGCILVADEIKKDAKKSLQNLKKNKIKKIIMLTGDRKSVGEDVAKKLKIDEAYTDLLPQDKVVKVESLLKEQKGKGKIAYVGDGINDAPALALSDVGIAMGGVGTDSAIEAADIVIMTDELKRIIHAINLSHKTMRIVTENIVFALFIKIIVLILAACGLSTMWEAVFADVGVSFIAVLNSLRSLNITQIDKH